MRERQRRICKDLRLTESNAHFRNTNRESSYNSLLWQIKLDLLTMLNIIIALVCFITLKLEIFLKYNMSKCVGGKVQRIQLIVKSRQLQLLIAARFSGHPVQYCSISNQKCACVPPLPHFDREILYSESNSINSIAKLPHIILSVFHVNLTGQGSRDRQMAPPPTLINFARMVLVYMCYVFGKQWVQECYKWCSEHTHT